MKHLIIKLKTIGDNSILGFFAKHFFVLQIPLDLQGFTIMISFDDLICSEEALGAEVKWLKSLGVKEIIWAKIQPSPV